MWKRAFSLNRKHKKNLSYSAPKSKFDGPGIFLIIYFTPTMIVWSTTLYNSEHEFTTSLVLAVLWPFVLISYCYWDLFCFFVMITTGIKSTRILRSCISSKTRHAAFIQLPRAFTCKLNSSLLSRGLKGHSTPHKEQTAIYFQRAQIELTRHSFLVIHDNISLFSSHMFRTL